MKTREPMATYTEFFAQLGWVEWTGRQAYQLDVDRYQSIVLVSVDDDQRVATQPAPTSLPNLGTSTPHLNDIWAHTGRITVLEAWKGRTPAPRVGYAGYVSHGSGRQRGPRLGPIERDYPAIGGWLYAGGRGLVFNVHEVARTSELGCVEGHFVSTTLRPGPPHLVDPNEYIEDTRHITALQRRHKSPPYPTDALMELTERGGKLAGYYVAEHLRWWQAVALLRRRNDSGFDKPSFDEGLLEGMLRMLALTRSGLYPSQTWHDVDDDRVAYVTHVAKATWPHVDTYSRKPSAWWTSVDCMTRGVPFYRVRGTGVACGELVNRVDEWEKAREVK